MSEYDGVIFNRQQSPLVFNCTDSAMHRRQPLLLSCIDTVFQCLRSKFKKIKSFSWTDSMAVLCRVTSNKIWKPHVLHRVQEIQKLTSKESLRFCQGSMNPVDLPSRGIKASELVKNYTWWNGSAFLRIPPHSEAEWPTSRNAC